MHAVSAVVHAAFSEVAGFDFQGGNVVALHVGVLEGGLAVLVVDVTGFFDLGDPVSSDTLLGEDFGVDRLDGRDGGGPEDLDKRLADFSAVARREGFVVGVELRDGLRLARLADALVEPAGRREHPQFLGQAAS